ncbi:MAG TPA: hypothetical protein GXX75_22745 [Clostridiales bacterium]|nr:hypothetical protein [Clostridiales bacterium]
MFFWNRVEIYSGPSLEEFSDLRSSLAGAKIKYDYRMKQPAAINTRHKLLPRDPSPDTRYYLYIHQKDYEHAMHLTSNRQSRG